MLQRIQTIWLFLAATCAFLSLKLPFYSGSSIADNNLSAFRELNGTENFYLMLLTIAIGVLALINIFLYANRKLQFRLCMLGIILEVLLIFLYYRLTTTEFSSGNYALTAVLQAGVLIFFFLAGRGIRNDDKIVKESNRLR